MSAITALHKTFLASPARSLVSILAVLLIDSWGLPPAVATAIKVAIEGILIAG